MRKILLMLFGLIMMASAEAIQINACQNITSADTYILNASILNSGADACFNVNASNVFFKCNNMTVRIDGTDAASTVGMNITNNVVNVTVADCYFSDWTVGLALHSTSDNNISNVVSNSSTTSGIDLWQAYNNTLNLITANANGNGIKMLNSDNNTLTNLILRLSTTDGIDVRTSSGNNITNVWIDDTSQVGMNIFVTSLNNIIRNVNSSNNQNGIQVGQTSNGNYLYDIVTDFNSQAGLRIGGNGINYIINATSRRNTLWGFLDSASAGITNFIYNSSIWSNTHDVIRSTTVAASTISGRNVTINPSFPLSFDLSGVVFGNGSAGGADPTDYRNMSFYFNMTNQSSWASGRINITYRDNNFPIEVERRITLKEWNGSAWLNITAFSNSYGVDTANDIFFANITFDALTNAQNINSSFGLFALNDSTLPIPQFVSPTEANGSTIPAIDRIRVNVTATDTSLVNVSLRLYSETTLLNETVSSQSIDITYFLLSNGNYFFNATATDAQGNQNSTETRTVTIAIQPNPTGGGGGTMPEEEPQVFINKSEIKAPEAKLLDLLTPPEQTPKEGLLGQAIIFVIILVIVLFGVNEVVK